MFFSELDSYFQKLEIALISNPDMHWHVMQAELFNLMLISISTFDVNVTIDIEFNVEFWREIGWGMNSEAPLK